MLAVAMVHSVKFRTQKLCLHMVHHHVSNQLDSLSPMSDEQDGVVDAVINGNTNAIVDSVAGIGKTTTIMNVAKACRESCTKLT